MCESFSNKKEGNGEREKRRYGENVVPSPIPRLVRRSLRKGRSSTPGTGVTTAASAEDEESAATSVLLLASE